ncbi:hypothetical protein ACS3QZ_09395 [Shimia sp. W99]
MARFEVQYFRDTLRWFLEVFDMIIACRFFLLFCALFVFTGQVTAQQLWTGSYVSRGKCSSFSGTVGPEQLSTVIQGHKYPHPKGSGIEFIDRNARGINAMAVGGGSPAQMKARLLNAARSNAFTRLDFEGPGGSSPAFVSAIVVESTAYAMSQLRARGAISAAEIKEVDAWVQKLLKNSTQRANSPDHKAAIGTARLLWGAAIGDKKQFSKGKSQLNSTFGTLRRKPVFSEKIRVNNEVMHQAVHAGIVLYRNGVDVFSKKQGKNSFHDAIAFHASQVAANGSKKLKTLADSESQARSIMRASGWGTHLAWIPLYLSHFPNSGAAKEVRALDRELRKVDRKPYYGQQIGIHSSCVYGQY